MKLIRLLALFLTLTNTACHAESPLVASGLYAIDTYDAIDETLDLRKNLPSKAEFENYKAGGICFTKTDVGSLEAFSKYYLSESAKKTCKVTTTSKNTWTTTCEESNKPKITYNGKVEFDGNRFASIIETKMNEIVISEISKGYLIKEKCN